MASETCKVLVTLARTFVEQGKPLHAIRCLQAVCLSDRAEYPQLEAEVKLESWLLKRLNGLHNLKCAVLARLAVCHRGLGQGRQLAVACETGLRTAQEGMRLASGRSELQQWAMHFYSLLAEAWSAGRDAAGALQCLRMGASMAADAHQGDSEGFTQALFHLGALQLHIEFGDAPQIPTATQEAARAIIALEASSAGPRTLPHLKLHFEVLRAAWLLARGEIIQLQKKEEGAKEGVPATVSQLQQLASEAAQCGVPYESLPADGALPPLAEVIAAAIWRPTGKFSRARTHLEAARAYLEAAERRQGLSLEDGESRLPLQQRLRATQLAWIRCLLLENAAIIALTKKELATAGGLILQLARLAAGFDRVSRHLKGHIHLLAGNYCMETGETEAAGSHFARALAGDSASGSITQRLAAVEAALYLLSSGRDSLSTPKAMQALKQNGLFCNDLGGYAAPESCAGHYATAMVLLKQGSTNEGRTYMMKALKLAHSPLHNHQLVAKIMCALVPTYLEDDLSAVQSMTSTALSLSKGLYDLPTQAVGGGSIAESRWLSMLQIAASKHTLTWMERSGAAAKVPEQEAYISRKEAQLRQAVEQATANAQQHSSLLSWDLAA